MICTAEQEISTKSRRLLHSSGGPGESAQLNRLKQGLRPGFPTCFSNKFPLNRQLRSRSRGVDWVASHYPLLLTYMFVRAVSVMSYLLLLVRLHDFRVVLMQCESDGNAAGFTVRHTWNSEKIWHSVDQELRTIVMLELASTSKWNYYPLFNLEPLPQYRPRTLQHLNVCKLRTIW